MKKMKMITLIWSLGMTAFAGDTNFVASFKTMWQTHNASNILVFVEQNVATNRSPETLFARGGVALMLQEWSVGATNYWEQAIQTIATNETHSATGRTNIIKEIRWLQDIVSTIDDNPLPSWNTNVHAVVFAGVGYEAPFFYTLQDIATIESSEQ